MQQRSGSGYVPLIDLAPARAGDAQARRQAGREIDTACRESGFLVITGHGIDEQLIDRVHDVTVELFAQPEADKRGWECPPDAKGLRGMILAPSYVSASEALATAPDICEMFTMSRLGEPGVADAARLGEAASRWGIANIWPDRPAELRSTWLEYFTAVEDLASDLIRLFAIGLGLDEHFFDEFFDHHITNLTANYYPPLDAPPAPNQYRKGPHSDWGTMTILYQDGTGGLEVVDHLAGGWVDVPVIEGTYVVNIGDLMARWTNDRWRSTKHRVRVPEPERRNVPRVSIPFFHHPNWDATIACLPSCTDEAHPARYPPVKSGTYIDERVDAVFTTEPVATKS